MRGHKPLFTFAVVADTHVNERDDASSSPYKTNQLANDRARFVFQDIAGITPAPKFVIHLGDIVHPVPSLPTFQDAVDRFKEISNSLTVPLHLVPGNHDVGDKRVDWMPADHVCDDYIQTYRKAFGPDYSAFDEGNVRFVLLNSLLLNSGLPEEKRQREWAEKQVASADGKRVFAFMHYPPYIYRTDERSNYDNIDEPARGWLLSLLRQPNVEAVFAGHVHNFWYDRIGEAEFYMLPSTAFVRHDFTEFYRVAPDVEFGRGDVEKFGYFLVDVYADGHVAHSVRTMGIQSKIGERPEARQPRQLAHPKTSTFDDVGVELRHPWTESMQITATGGVQEFGRKWARNDYPLLALWEMGARLSKVPDLDLIEAELRARMQLLARLGHRYLVTALGAPKKERYPETLADYGVTGFEVNSTLAGFVSQKARLKKFRVETGSQVFFSKILTFDASHFDGKHFSHFVKAGFALDELETHRDLIATARKEGEIDGITVRIEADQPLISAATRMVEFANDVDCLILASLKLSGPSLAAERSDDRANVASAAQAMILSKAGRRVRYVFDTFMDVDRGYYPRHAFIDRRFNPRPAAHVFTTLTSLFSNAGSFAVNCDIEAEDGALPFKAGDELFVLLWDTTSRMIARVSKIGGRGGAFDLVGNCEQPVDGLKASMKGSLNEFGELLQVILMRL